MIKKLFIMLLAVCFFAGCGSLQLNDNSKDVLVKTASRLLGYQIGLNNINKITIMSAVCQQLSEADSIDAVAIDSLYGYLQSAIGADPILAASLADLASLVSYTPGGDLDIGILKTIIGGFYEGLVIAKETTVGAI